MRPNRARDVVELNPRRKAVNAVRPLDAGDRDRRTEHIHVEIDLVRNLEVEVRFDDAGVAGPVEPGRRMVTLGRVDDQRGTAALDLEFRAVKPFPVAAADSIDRDVAPIAGRDDDPA